MITTEKKHWLNGKQKRAKDFYTFAFSFNNKAVLLSFCWSAKYFDLDFYKLV